MHNNLEITFFMTTVSVLTFVIGILGLVLNRSNILKTIMALELLLLAINISFIVFSIYLDDFVGQIFILFILTLSATESAIGLSLLAMYYEHKDNIILDTIKMSNSNKKY